MPSFRTCQWCQSNTYTNGTCSALTSACPASTTTTSTCATYCHYATDCASCMVRWLFAPSPLPAFLILLCLVRHSQAMQSVGCGWCDTTNSCVSPQNYEHCPRVLQCPAPSPPPSKSSSFSAGKYPHLVTPYVALTFLLVSRLVFWWHCARLQLRRRSC